MRTILGTPNGVRYFLGEFNCRLNELIEEPNDSIVLTLIRSFIEESFIKWQKSITVVDVKYQQGQNHIVVSVSYYLKSSKESGSFIFPFYNQLKY